MTVTTTHVRNSYTANGVLTVFPVTFQFRDETDLDVYRVTSFGTVTQLLLNTDYTVTMNVNFTGEINLIGPPLSGGRVVIIRQNNFVQSTSSIGQEEFTAKQVEDIADIDLMLIQELADTVSRSLTLGITDLDGSGAYDAQNNRIKNLGAPVDLDDAVSMRWARESFQESADLVTDIDNLSTKSPIINWEGRIALVLGTSIPHQGGSVDSYHGLMGKSLGFTVVNNAWSGSSARYLVNADPFEITTVKRLSMTEDDRQAGLALYGPSSAYDDSFDVITKASQMTADYRIKTAFANEDISVVFLDHNHNDRIAPYGTLDPPSSSITGITKGVTTTITLGTTGIFAVGDAIAIQVGGITKLNYFAGRVQSVAGNTVTVNVNSSGFAGTFSNGTAYKYDRSMLYGAFEFLISYIKWAAALYDRTTTIILNGAPSAYTNNVFNESIRTSSEAIKEVATKWGLAYFDIEYELAIDAQSHLVYFSDGVHPMEPEARQVIANYWTEWGSGGAILRPAEGDFLVAGSDTFTDSREAFYTKFKDAFTTPPVILGAPVSVVNENFSGGLGGWTLAGSGTLPTTVVAPWNAAETAVYCISNGSSTSYLDKTGLVLDKGLVLQFDVYIPAVTGLNAASLPATVQIVQFRSAGGAYYTIQMIVYSDSVKWRVRYFETPNVSLKGVPTYSLAVAAATKHTVRFESYRGEVDYPGGVYVTVDGVRLTLPDDITDSGQSIPTILRLGISSCNTGLPFPLYLDNVTLSKRAVSDFSLRGSGTFTTTDGKTVTVVNGIITAINP